MQQNDLRKSLVVTERGRRGRALSSPVPAQSSSAETLRAGWDLNRGANEITLVHVFLQSSAVPVPAIDVLPELGLLGHHLPSPIFHLLR